MTRVPTKDDFAGLATPPRPLTITTSFPDPPASTTAILLLFHGLGDDELPFAQLARAMRLPGVLAIAVRGPAVIPPLLVADAALDNVGDNVGDGPANFHWGDDLHLDAHGALDTDPGFDKAISLVDERLVQDILIGQCGWRYDDVLLFGFGQGATFALAYAARTRATFKGIVAVGGALPAPITMASSAQSPLDVPLLVCGARGSDAVSEETRRVLQRVFCNVTLARWDRRDPNDAGMMRTRAEMYPVMQFLAQRLQ